MDHAAHHPHRHHHHRHHHHHHHICSLNNTGPPHTQLSQCCSNHCKLDRRTQESLPRVHHRSVRSRTPTPTEPLTMNSSRTTRTRYRNRSLSNERLHEISRSLYNPAGSRRTAFTNYSPDNFEPPKKQIEIHHYHHSNFNNISKESCMLM